jgi:hypothetical protein
LVGAFDNFQPRIGLDFTGPLMPAFQGSAP